MWKDFKMGSKSHDWVNHKNKIGGQLLFLIVDHRIFEFSAILILKYKKLPVSPSCKIPSHPWLPKDEREKL